MSSETDNVFLIANIRRRINFQISLQALLTVRKENYYKKIPASTENFD